jgi:hypothetical protein
MLTDILESAKQSLFERLSSPLLGAFFLSWCAWNWKFLVILLSDTSITTTFSLIESIAFPDYSTTIFRGLVFPLLSACAYVFIYPYPARFVYDFTLRRQREINQTKQRISDETPLTIEESRRIRSEYIEKERSHVALVQELSDEIARLNEALGARDKQIKASPPSDAEIPHDRLDESQLELLRLLEMTGGESPEQDLIQQSSETKVKTEFNIGELERRDLVSRHYSNRARAYIVAFTHDGRRALIESQQAVPRATKQSA